MEFFPVPYFPVFGLNAGKYGPEKTLYLDIYHVVQLLGFMTTSYFTEQNIMSHYIRKIKKCYHLAQKCIWVSAET